MKKIIAFAVLGVMLVALMLTPAVPEVEASNPCRTTYYSYPQSNYCYPSYSQPTYIYRDVIREVPVAYPVPFTVAVPVVSYLYNGGGYTYAPVYNAQPTAGMGTVSQAPQQQQPAQAAPFDASQLTDAQVASFVDRIDKYLRAKNGNGNNGNGHVNGNGAKSTPPPAVPSDVYTILTLKRGNDQKSCMDCHTGSSAKGGQKIFLEPGKLNPDADWAAIWDTTDTGAMPPEVKKNRAAALSDQEVDVLRQKMKETAKNGKK